MSFRNKKGLGGKFIRYGGPIEKTLTSFRRDVEGASVPGAKKDSKDLAKKEVSAGDLPDEVGNKRRFN